MFKAFLLVASPLDGRQGLLACLMCFLLRNTRKVAKLGGVRDGILLFGFVPFRAFRSWMGAEKIATPSPVDLRRSSLKCGTAYGVFSIKKSGRCNQLMP